MVTIATPPLTPPPFVQIAEAQLCLNVTSSFLLLVRETTSNWQQDIKSYHDTRNWQEQQLLKMHRRSSSRDEGTDVTPTPSSTNVEQGLALLHSVRFISQTRQRVQFVPFILRNSTGVPLRFRTLTSLPAKVLFNPSTLLQQQHRQQQHRQQQPQEKTGELHSAQWVAVKPDEDVPFDFTAKRKQRHQDTRELIVHQLSVQVEGWLQLAVPISVDKVGLFFREVMPDHTYEHAHSSHQAFKVSSLSVWCCTRLFL